jgi:hypothetical protein
MGEQFENKKNNRKVIYDNDAIYVAIIMTTNQIERDFHGSFGYIRCFAFYQWL